MGGRPVNRLPDTRGVSTVADEELQLLSNRLDLAYRETAERVPMNLAVTIVNRTEGADLSLESLEKIAGPPSLIALRAAIDAHLPRLDLPALRRSRLSWVKQNFLRAETLTAANVALVAAQNAITLAKKWGGDVASADGLRFVVPVRTIHSGPNPRYFGQERWHHLV